MKILGLNPKDFYAGWPVQSDFGRELYRTPALTFPVLKQLLPPGHEMKFLEGFFDPVPMSRYKELIKWADVVGFNIASSYGAISYGVAIKQVKRLNPDAFIIAGGHHTMMYPRRWLDLGVDLVVKGEAELTFASIIEEVQGKRRFERIPGVVFKQDGEYVETAPPPQIETLDESPVPDWDLINFEAFPCLIERGGGYTGSLECSRGCVFRCKFCAVPPYWQGTQRYKSPGRVMEEVKQLVARNVRQINVVDDGFGNDFAYTDELVDAFLSYPDMPVWNAFLRVDTCLSHPELIDKLARSGMKTTLLGFESLHPDVLKSCMGKGMRQRPDLSDMQRMYQRFKRNGIMVIGVFISGHPDIDEEKDTPYRLARTVCDDPRLADYMPFPGTAGFDELSQSYTLKDMFFHDVKLPVFPGQKLNAFKFNLMNIVDVPRSIHMLRSGYHYRSYLYWSHHQLWKKALRVNRMKLRDYMLMRRKDLSADEKQEKLLAWYLDDPAYQQWLDGLSNKVFF
ncbi:MAG: radical SAM protein [bacterium]